MWDRDELALQAAKDAEKAKNKVAPDAAGGTGKPGAAAATAGDK